MKGVLESIMACVDRFAPEKPWIRRNKSDEWITGKIKHAINKRDEPVQLRIKKPTESSCKMYKNVGKESRKRYDWRKKNKFQNTWIKIRLLKQSITH